MRTIYLLLFGVLSCMLLTTCSSYHPVSVEKNTFYNNERIPEKIDKYQVYVHEGSHLYRLANATFKQDTIRGILDPVEPGTINTHPDSRSESKLARNNLHVYLAKSTKELTSVKDSSATIKRVAIDRNAVEHVDMFAKDQRTGWQKFGFIAGLIIVGALAVIAIIYASIAASADASADSKSGSNNDSGDSGSGDSNTGGSNSNSEGSNSGDSGSGGSESGVSGCYVATMVYGSYDAPNVLVLRLFRDHFLAKFSGGRSFIRWYYTHSPSFVIKHKDRKLLHAFIRSVLNLFVWLIRPVFRRF